MTDRLSLRRPDDWHLHLRDGAMLAAVVPASAPFGRALVMPNLVPPVVTAADARAYARRIAAAGPAFRPLLTLYLTEGTDPDDVAAAAADGLVTAVKLYPAGATTNSASGVRDLAAVRPVLERMERIGLPLCLHGEVTDPDIDIFDREAVFVERVLAPLRRDHPGLKITLEHITTAEGLAFVREAPGPIAGTITVHHLMLERSDMLAGGIRPHYYCLPILKRRRHRDALVAAATGGEARFFLGTDSAPHLARDKESACGCAGVFSAPVALPCLAQVFDDAGALDRLEAFCSLNGAAHYGLPPSEETVALERGAHQIPPPLQTANGPVVPFDPGRPIGWRVAA